MLQKMWHVLTGHYAVGGENVPCLIYATFSNRIVVYHGIHLSQIGTTNLIKTMDEHEEVRELLAYFNCDGIHNTLENIRENIHEVCRMI